MLLYFQSTSNKKKIIYISCLSIICSLSQELSDKNLQCLIQTLPRTKTRCVKMHIINAIKIATTLLIHRRNRERKVKTQNILNVPLDRITKQKIFLLLYVFFIIVKACAGNDSTSRKRIEALFIRGFIVICAFKELYLFFLYFLLLDDLQLLADTK